jgi:hypothetical protein
MNICKKVLSVQLLVILSVMSTGSYADDLTPPPWRDLAYQYSTLSAWDFNTSANPAAPDGHGPSLPAIVGNGGTPPIAPSATMSPNMQYDATSGGWGPIDLLPGQIHLYIPNWIDNEPLKLIRVQMTYLGDPGAQPSVDLVTGADNVTTAVVGTPIGLPVIQILDPPFNTQYHLYHDWQMLPNPDYEFIDITVPRDTIVHQIVVDTISTVPEPASAVLVGLAIVLAGGGMHWRKRLT